MCWKRKENKVYLTVTLPIETRVVGIINQLNQLAKLQRSQLINKNSQAEVKAELKLLLFLTRVRKIQEKILKQD